jgi:hypothetical protein
MWTDWQPEVVDADLRQLAEGGLRVLRVFPLWPDFQPITLLRGGQGYPREVRLGEAPLPDTPEGQAGLSAEMLERFAAFCDLAEKHGLQLVVGLLTGWMSGRLFVPPALEGRNPLTDPLALMWEVRFARAFVRRFKGHPAIRAWDLGNECNVMGPVDTPEAAYAWVAAITNAIHAEDPTREVVSGLHGGGPAWKHETMGELTDLLTTHPYPLWTVYCDQDPVDTIRTLLHSTVESRLYADTGGKPCLVEETGVMGPMIANDEAAARFLRTILFSTWAHDLRGLLWWCAYDQTHLAHAPYDWNTVERELGLVRVDRAPKPVLAELGRFGDFLAGLPERGLPPFTREAVCVLPQDVDTWGLAYSTFVLAKQAGFDLEFQQADAPLKPAAQYLVPSIRGINVVPRRRWLDLLARVREGAALYVSLDDGLLAEFEETFGLRVRSRARRADGAVTFMLDGQSYTLPAPFRLELETLGARVLAREPDGNPAITVCDYGKGSVTLCAAPLERALTERPGAFYAPGAPPFYRIYQTIAAPALEAVTIRKDHPLLGLTRHPLDDGRAVVVAINYAPEPVQANLTLTDGWRMGEAWYGAAEGVTLSVPPNDAVVFTIQR